MLAAAGGLCCVVIKHKKHVIHHTISSSFSRHNAAISNTELVCDGEAEASVAKAIFQCMCYGCF